MGEYTGPVDPTCEWCMTGAVHRQHPHPVARWPIPFDGDCWYCVTGRSHNRDEHTTAARATRALRLRMHEISIGNPPRFGTVNPTLVPAPTPDIQPTRESEEHAA